MDYLRIVLQIMFEHPSIGMVCCMILGVLIITFLIYYFRNFILWLLLWAVRLLVIFGCAIYLAWADDWVAILGAGWYGFIGKLIGVTLVFVFTTD